MSIISKVKMPGSNAVYDIGADWENIKDKPDVGSIDVGVSNEILNIDTNDNIAIVSDSIANQSDYSEDDSTSAIYIKNRPLSLISLGNTYTFDDVTETTGQYASLTYYKVGDYVSLEDLLNSTTNITVSGEPYEISNEEVFREIVSEVSDSGYEGESFISGIDSMIISCDNAFYVNDDGMIINFPEAGLYFYTENPYGIEWDITIHNTYSINENYKDFFNKYRLVSDSYGKNEIPQSDWNMTDETNITYIKNKPQTITLPIELTSDVIYEQNDQIRYRGWILVNNERVSSFSDSIYNKYYDAFLRGSLTFTNGSIGSSTFSKLYKPITAIGRGGSDITGYGLMIFNHDDNKYYEVLI